MALTGSPTDKSHAIVANSIVLPPTDGVLTEPDCIRCVSQLRVTAPCHPVTRRGRAGPTERRASRAARASRRTSRASDRPAAPPAPPARAAGPASRASDRPSRRGCFSNKSLGSHKNRRLEDGSHYGSGSSLDSFEKRNRDDLESGTCAARRGAAPSA